MLDVEQAIRQRSSIRAFLPRAVPKEEIVALLELARWAPSGSNRQPWRVKVVTSQALEGWRKALEQHLTIDNWSPAQREAFANRVRENGLGPLEKLAGRPLLDLLVGGSFRFYNAPVVLVVAFPGTSDTRRPDAIAAFVTTLMLAAHARGLGTCWLGFPMCYPALVRRYAGLAPEEQPGAVVALGYPDPEAPENSFRAPRRPVDAFTQWVSVL